MDRQVNNNIIVVDNNNYNDPSKEDFLASAEALFKHRRRLYTGLIFLMFLFYGAAFNIWGPSWNALVAMFETDQESMSYANSLFALGYLTGSMTCAYVFRHLNRQLSITFYLLLMCACVGFTPLLRSLPLFYGFAFLFGMSEGGVDTGANSWLLEMWTEENAMLMQALYFFFGVGTFVSPFIMFNFLSEENTNDLQESANSLNSVNPSNYNYNLTFTDRTITLSPNASSPTPHLSSNLSIHSTSLELSAHLGSSSTTIVSDISTPYFVIAACLLIVGCINLFSYIAYRYKPKEESLILRLKDDKNHISHAHNGYGTINKSTVMMSSNEQLTPEEDEKVGWTRKLISLVAISAVILCFYDGFENITFEYFASFLIYSPFTTSEATAAQMATIMSGSFTLVRGFAIVAVKWIQPKTFILIDTILMFVGVTLVYYSMSSADMDMETNGHLIAGVVLWGAGMATFLPALYSYIEEHIRMTDSVCSILHLSCAIITPFEPVLVGKLIVSLPQILLYVCYGSLAITAIALGAFECTKSLL